MGKFKVTFTVDELHTCESDMREFLQTTEGISDVNIEYIGNNPQQKGIDKDANCNNCKHYHNCKRDDNLACIKHEYNIDDRP